MLTDEEKHRLQELVWKNEASAGRPKEYYAQSRALENVVPKTCTHDVAGCRVCLIAEAVAAERERCAKIAEQAIHACYTEQEQAIAYLIADHIRKT